MSQSRAKVKKRWFLYSIPLHIHVIDIVVIWTIKCCRYKGVIITLALCPAEVKLLVFVHLTTHKRAQITSGATNGNSAMILEWNILINLSQFSKRNLPK